MTATKRKTKTAALKVPQTAEAADALLAAAGEAMNRLAEIGASLARETAALKSAHEAEAGPHKDALKTIEKQLQAYAEARRDELTAGGKTKTIQMPSGVLLWRTRPPSVAVKGKVGDVVSWLVRSRFAALFLRTKHELDKEAMLKAPDAAAKVPGIAIVRDEEEFAILPAGLKLAEEAT